MNYEANALVDAHFDAVLRMQDEIKKRSPDIDQLNERADSVDDEADAFRLILQKHCAFIPSEIVARLDKFYESISEEFDGLVEGHYTQVNFDKIWQHLEGYEQSLEEIDDLMRKDVGVEAIDRRLKARTHSKTKQRD